MAIRHVLKNRLRITWDKYVLWRTFLPFLGRLPGKENGHMMHIDNEIIMYRIHVHFAWKYHV